MNASVTLPARSETEARTLRASAVPASHRWPPISLAALIGTLRHELAPSTWYSRTSDLRFRFSSLTSQRTDARLPRLSSGSSKSDGGNVSTTTFRFGSIVDSSDGETLPSIVRVCTANQYSPSCDERNVNVGWSGNVLLIARQWYPRSSETRRCSSLTRSLLSGFKLNGIRKLRAL